MAQRFWGGYAHVCPSHFVETTLPGGRTHMAQRYARGSEQAEGARRVLGHAGAMRLVHSLAIAADHPVAIVCAVPRLSDDYNADHERLSRFVSAVFFGEPTEGLDASPIASSAE